MKSNVILFLLGILICATGPVNAQEIILTKNNHINFTGEVSDSSVAKAQMDLTKVALTAPGSVVYLVLDTPGGSVSAGNLFIDYAKSLPLNIKPICIFCASMGYHFFQSFGERLVYPSSALMSHRAKLGGLSGQVPGELESRLANIKRILNQMDDVAAKRVGLSREAYQKLIYDELWYDGQTAVATKHADRLAKIRCANELASETYEQTFDTLFGQVTLIMSKCPLITGPIDFKLGANSKFRSKAEALVHVRKVKRSVMWRF